MSTKSWSNWWSILSIGIILGGGTVVGLLASFNSSKWFKSLKKPSFSPPNSLFGIAWTVLYSLMGLSVWFIIKQWSDSPQAVLKALIIFGIQYALNLAWTPTFVNSESLLGSLALISALDIFTVWNIAEFWCLNRVSALLLLPYLGWLLFATALNFEYARLNADRII